MSSWLVEWKVQETQEEVTRLLCSFITEGRNMVHAYAVPRLTSVPLLLPTSLWHLQPHSDENSSPDFKGAHQGFEGTRVTMFLSQEIWQERCITYISRWNSESTRPQSQFYMWHWSSDVPLSKGLSYDPLSQYSQQPCKVDNIIPMQDEATKAQRLNNLPQTTWK